MGKYVIKNGKILYNGYDLSGDHNQIGLTVSREEKECTTFGKAGVQRIAGLQSFDVSGSGFFEAGTGKTDTVIAPTLGTSSAELTIMPQGTSAGSKCFIGEINTFEYAPGGSVGDVMGFTFAGKSEGTVLVEGNVLKSGSITTDGTGTILNIGQIASGRVAYATLHVTATSGSANRALTVTIQSDNTTGFSSPTTRVTFTQITNAVASEWKSTTYNSSTDAYWRAKWGTVGTTARAFMTHVAFGISYI